MRYFSNSKDQFSVGQLMCDKKLYILGGSQGGGPLRNDQELGQ